jgi:hypothetical protein
LVHNRFRNMAAFTGNPSFAAALIAFAHRRHP